MSEEQPIIEEPKKRGWPKGKKRKVVQLAPVEQAKPKRIRRQSITPDKHVAKRMKRLSLAMDDTASIEIYRLAALQVVASKLDEVAALLKTVTPFTPVVQRQVAMPQARMPLTLENIDRLDPQPQVMAGPTCALCGHPASTKNDRGMPLCPTHAGKERLEGMLKKGFGRGGAEEVIQISSDQIQAALTQGE